MKRTLAIFLILALCVSVMWLANPLAPVTKVAADTYRSGFQLYRRNRTLQESYRIAGLY